MPKKKDALALRDFDKERILQRRYFKDLELAQGTDEEIISALKILPEGKTIDDWEAQLRKIQNLRRRLSEYHKLIERHQLRWERVEKYVHDKLNLPENDEMILRPAEYGVAETAIFELQKKTDNLFREVDAKIQRRYRRELATRLRHYRKAAGLSQQELGERTFTSQRGIAHYDKGDTDIPSYVLIKICRALNITTAKLLGQE